MRENQHFELENGERNTNTSFFFSVHKRRTPMQHQCPMCGNRYGFYPQCSCRRKYGCLHFLGDIFMCCITGGLWLIWIFIREMRDRR